MAETTEPRAQEALRWISRAFVTLGVALLPAALADRVAHPVAQFMLSAGSLAGLLVLSRGLGMLQGRELNTAWITGLIAGSALTMAVAMAIDLRAFGTVYALGLACVGSLTGWLTFGFLRHPRDQIERALGAAFMALAASGWVRLAFTLADAGPARAELMYGPQWLTSTFAVLYGLMPMFVATLLLNLVNSRLRQQLRSLAVTDELTGTMTRRAVRELAPDLIAQARRRDRDVAVLMLDLDRFKDVNDTHGHAAGDAVLRQVATTLQSHLRADAMLARYGGEEFVAVIPVEDLRSARRVAERLREAIEESDWAAVLGRTCPVTVSVGVTLMRPGDALDAALHRADEALYLAKRNGRNQCQFNLAVA
ncbi:MAG: GGDEF domain-containing protein [Ideonella sp.]|nr:GGDEF domain-containing protein [Ideonella sp.]